MIDADSVEISVEISKKLTTISDQTQLQLDEVFSQQIEPKPEISLNNHFTFA
jgi:hypothetical protein